MQLWGGGAAGGGEVSECGVESVEEMEVLVVPVGDGTAGPVCRSGMYVYIYICICVCRGICGGN